MDLTLRDGFVDELKVLGEKSRHFSIMLSPNEPYNMSAEESFSILSSLLKPIISTSIQGHIYNDGDLDLDYYGEPVKRFLVKSRGKYILSIDDEIFSYNYIGFWSSENCSRGSLIFEKNINEIDFISLFKKALDPFIVDNLGSVISKSAIKFARQQLKTNDDKVFFCLSSSDGLGCLTIFASSRKIGDLIELVMKNCSFSDHYILRYSEPVIGK